MCQNVEKKEYEIICVDDGSTDSSLKILNDFAKDNENIKVYHKENGEVSSARNLGIEKSGGEYIWFVDGDDCIKAKCLGGIFDIIYKHHTDIMYLKNGNIDEEYCFKEEQVEKLDYCIRQSRDIITTVWSAIINAKIIKDNNIKYAENIKYGEDALFMGYIYLYSDTNNIYIDNELYLYRSRDGSAMRNHFRKEISSKHTKDVIFVANTFKKLYKEKVTMNKKKIKGLRVRQYWETEEALVILPKSDLDYKNTIRDLKNNGLYPYPMWFSKVCIVKGIKEKTKQFFKLFFKFELLYKIYYKKIKKQQKKFEQN